jgi:hypothetical protein
LLGALECLQLWDSVEQRCKSTAGHIDALAADFRAAECSLRSAAEAALAAMLADMSDIAHLDEGRLQRLVEQEALALNKLLLDNRCAAGMNIISLVATYIMLDTVLLVRLYTAG